MFALSRASICVRQALITVPKHQFATRNTEPIRTRLSKNAGSAARGFGEKPVSDTPFAIGRAATATAAAVGVGALCFYGLSSGTGSISAIDKAAMWPSYVKERVHETYAYFGASLLLSAGSAVAVFRTPALMNLAARGGMMAMLGSMALCIGSGMVCMSLPYPDRGFGAKHAAWAVHSSILGAVLAPVCLLGGPLVLRAALYTAGIVGGLSAVAVCAPSEKFLTMGGPLAIGLGVVFVSSIGSMFLSPVSALGAGLYSISLYGGLIVFSGFLLYDTQKIIRNAESHPPVVMVGMPPYDPINNSIGIYLDTVNIFIRMVTILSGGGSRKR